MELPGLMVLAITALVVATVVMMAASTLPTEAQRNIAYLLAVALCIGAIVISLGSPAIVLAALAIVLFIGIPSGISMSQKAP